MAAVTVTADNARINAADATTNWGNIGGGAGIGLEPDFVYQGNGSISRKIGTARRGLEYTHTSTTDMTATNRRAWICKVIATNSGALLSAASPGAIIYLGNAAGVNYEYQFLGGDTYPIKGGWVIEAIDPSVAAYRDVTNGSPNLTQIDYFGIDADFNATSKSENLAMDAIDIGAGLVLSGGDGGDADGVFQDYVDEDEGTTANRWGYVTTQGGIIFVLGTLTQGDASATVFDDSNITVVFSDSFFAAGYSGLEADLTNAGTSITYTSCNFIGRGSTTDEDTRPIYTTTATSGTLLVDSCAFTNFATLTFNSAADVTDTTVNDTESFIVGGATVDNCVFNSPAVATSVAFMETSDLALVSNCTFNSSGTGHAIEITATGSYTFTGNVFNNYGASGSNDAAIFNDTGGLVTINVAGGGSTPTFRNGAGASTVVNNNISITLTGMVDGTEVRVYSEGTITELAGIENVTAGTVDNRSFTFALGAGVVIDIVVHNIDYEYIRINSFTIPVSDSSIPIQQRFDRTQSNP